MTDPWYEQMIDEISDYVILGPERWPCWLRRSFVLTFPISVPLYIAGAGVILFLASVVMLVAATGAGLASMWRK